jgi:predicted ribosomally synthesized peptide with nif11-like leader
MDELVRKVEELTQNEEFKLRISQMENAEEIVEAFRAEGVEITSGDLQAAIAAQKSGELSEDMLENVSGGALGLAARIRFALILIISKGKLFA